MPNNDLPAEPSRPVEAQTPTIAAAQLKWLADNEYDLRTHREASSEDEFFIWWTVVNPRAKKSLSHPYGSPYEAIRAAGGPNTDAVPAPPADTVIHKTARCPGCDCSQTLPESLQQCICSCHWSDRKTAPPVSTPLPTIEEMSGLLSGENCEAIKAARDLPNSPVIPDSSPNSPGSREQIISFAYGNTHMHNPSITREMIAAAYDELHPVDAPAVADRRGTTEYAAQQLDTREREWRKIAVYRVGYDIAGQLDRHFALCGPDLPAAKRERDAAVRRGHSRVEIEQCDKYLTPWVKLVEADTPSDKEPK